MRYLIHQRIYINTKLSVRDVYIDSNKKYVRKKHKKRNKIKRKSVA